ncbi:putative [histone H3]-lysine(4) N-trimethyltransferase chromatin remodeling SET family [Helianthus anomalus]
MTQHCGWGVEAVELIDEGDYIIEYVGEVINDALCEKRFWDMKGKGITKFYMVAVRKDFNIDARFKGNESRFINHSCDPNCTMEKWDVNGETRLGIFAAKTIEPREELTFDYEYEMYGPDEVECHCGASNCHGYLGTKRSDAGDCVTRAATN